MSRGGRREGAGRKAAITRMQAIQVGAECEAVWTKLAQDQARTRYESKPEIGQVIAAQARAQMVPVKMRQAPRRETRETLEEVTEDIDAVVGKSRVGFYEVARPYAERDHVITAAIEWCQRTYGIKISRSKAVECWKTYKKLEKELSSSV